MNARDAVRQAAYCRSSPGTGFASSSYCHQTVAPARVAGLALQEVAGSSPASSWIDRLKDCEAASFTKWPSEHLIGRNAPVCLFVPFQRLFADQTHSRRRAGLPRARAVRLRAGSSAFGPHATGSDKKRSGVIRVGKAALPRPIPRARIRGLDHRRGGGGAGLTPRGSRRSCPEKAQRSRARPGEHRARPTSAADSRIANWRRPISPRWRRWRT